MLEYNTPGVRQGPGINRHKPFGPRTIFSIIATAPEMGPQIIETVKLTPQVVKLVHDAVDAAGSELRRVNLEVSQPSS